jgi:hypothetical protein
VLSKFDTGQLRPSSGTLTVDNRLDLYLDGSDADKKLSAKTRFDYREKAVAYVRPLGNVIRRSLFISLASGRTIRPIAASQPRSSAQHPTQRSVELWRR